MSLRRFIDGRLVLFLVLVMMIGAIAAAVLLSRDGDRGGEAEATVAEIVVDDENQHTVFVDFVTAEGVACHANVDSGAFGYSPAPVVAGRFLIMYEDGDPCGYVQRVPPPGAGYYRFLLFAGFIVAVVALIYWRRPELLVFGGKRL